MERQALRPGVKHRQHAESHSEMPGISSHLQQRRRSRAEQQPVDDLRATPSPGPQAPGHGEDHMEVRHRQQLFAPSGKPVAEQIGSDCKINVCDGQGSVIAIDDDTDVVVRLDDVASVEPLAA